MQETTEFSFVLKPSNIAGVGVFATHDIGVDTRLVMWPDNYEARLLHENDIPKNLRHYCVARDKDIWACPANFNMMEIAWYLNHSKKPNATKKADGQFYSLTTIKAGDEITIDYNQLGEPETKKEDYYRESSNSKSD